MKSSIDVRWIIVAVVLLLVLGGCGGGRVVTKTFLEENILSLAEVQALPDRTNPNNIVVKLDKGENIPVFLNLESELMVFAEDHVNLQLKEPLYFRLQGPDEMTEEDWRLLESFDEEKLAKMDKKAMEEFLDRFMLFVSRDAVQWAPITGGKACKQVLGIEGGEFTMGLVATSEAGVRANLNVIMHSVGEQ